MDDLPAKSLQLFQYVRQRPGMYFGPVHSGAIRSIAPLLIDFVVHETVAINPSGPIVASVKSLDSGDVISIEAFDRWLASAHSPTEDIDIDQLISSNAIFFAPAVSNSFVLQSCDGHEFLSIRISKNGKIAINRKIIPPRHPFIRVRLRPSVSTFQRVIEEDIYILSGMLRNASLLNAGLTTRLRSGLWNGEIGWHYKHGLRDFLFEEDHQRFPLHRGCISFSASRNGMSVECHLRFLHAGTPHLRDYVNRAPIQGGAHRKGLGDALLELFPDATRGCRTCLFVTNPDTGATVTLPHPFIAAMHLTVPNPRFYGPTKDVLCGDEFREFVRLAATEPLKQQWNELRNQR